VPLASRFACRAVGWSAETTDGLKQRPLFLQQETG